MLWLINLKMILNVCPEKYYDNAATNVISIDFHQINLWRILLKKIACSPAANNYNFQKSDIFSLNDIKNARQNR